MSTAPIAQGPVDVNVRPPHAGSHVFKVPKFLLTPPTYWAEVVGVRRAIKVIDLQAAHLRQQGNNRAAHDLRDVARALKAAITKENAVAECITLGWPNAKVTGSPALSASPCGLLGSAAGDLEKG